MNPDDVSVGEEAVDGLAGSRPINHDRRLITRVVLRNYKSIAACDVAPAQLTFLVGPNGSGKSNFLDAIRFVADSLRFSIDHSLRDRGGIKEVRRRSGRHPDHFGVRLEFNLGDSRGCFAFRIGAESKGGYQIQREECYLIRRAKPPEYFRVDRGRVVGTSLPQTPAVARDRLFLASVSGERNFRVVGDALSSAGFYNLRPEAIRNLQPPDPGDLMNRDGSNIASVLSRLARRAPDVRHRIEEYLSKIVPGVAGVGRVSAGPRETLQFRQRVGGASHPWRFYASSMSDGTLRACGVLLALFQRAGSDASVPWLVGIEEPEAALHPAGVSVLVDSLRDASAYAQVVVTSHSADLLDDPMIKADQVIAVLSEGGQTHIGPMDEVGRSVLRDRLYTAGELLRMNQVDPDPSRSRLEPGQLNLFEPFS